MCDMQISFTQVLSVNAKQPELSISSDSSPSFHSTANSFFSAKITWRNLHAPSRCRVWWMPTTHTRPSETQHNSTFIAKDNHYVLFCKISFRTDPVNLFRFGFNVSAEKKVYCWVLHHIIYVQATVLQFQCSIFASFCFNGAAGKAQTCQVYGCVRHCVKP